jgi:putative peptide zinc metalloprotease protein
MTVLDPGASAATAREGVDAPVPAEGVTVLGVAQGSGYRKPPALIRRGDGQILQVTPLLSAVMDAIDGRRSYDEIAAVAGTEAGRTLHPDDVRMLVAEKLRPLGLVLGADGTAAAVKKSNPLLALRMRFVVSKPEVTRRITAPFAVLFTPSERSPTGCSGTRGSPPRRTRRSPAPACCCSCSP